MYVQSINWEKQSRIPANRTKGFFSNGAGPIEHSLKTRRLDDYVCTWNIIERRVDTTMAFDRTKISLRKNKRQQENEMPFIPLYAHFSHIHSAFTFSLCVIFFSRALNFFSYFHEHSTKHSQLALSFGCKGISFLECQSTLICAQDSRAYKTI